MEGTQCDEPGCRCHDFLPFQCQLCDNVYCLEHRSRFSHTCNGINNSNGINNNHISNNNNHESVRDIFNNVSNRFDNTNNTKAREHYNIQTSNDNSNTNINNSTMNRINNLNNTANNKSVSLKQRNISNKTKVMYVKTKAIGNPNISQEDRIYLSIHFTDNIEQLSNNNTNSNQIIYLYFPSRLTIGELLQNILNNYYNIIIKSASFISNNKVNKLKKEDIILAMSTIDTPQWWMWDRNATIGSCFSELEDLAVFVVPLQEAIHAQHELQNKRTIPPPHHSASGYAAPRQHQPSPPPHHYEDHYHTSNNNHTPSKFQVAGYAATIGSSSNYSNSGSKRQLPLSSTNDSSSALPSTSAVDLLTAADYQKGQLAWYHRIPKTDLEQIKNVTLQDIERQLPMILVKIAGVHHDDYPNIYYTIQQVSPIQITNVTGASGVGFDHEKQTDQYHLFPTAIPKSNTSSNTTATAANRNNTQQPHPPKKHDRNSIQATRDLLESLAKMGSPMTIKPVHGKHSAGNITVGSDCTIGQLKTLLGAIFDIPVPSVKLISKGHTFNNNNQKLIDSKLSNNSKVMVLGGAMVV